MRWLGFLLVFAFVDASAAERVVAYVASWKLPPAIHAQKLTHLNIAFAHIDKDHRVFVDSDAAIRSLVGLKLQNPKLKVLLSVGGWQAEGFSDAALTEDSRHAFRDSAMKLLDAFHLDGLDVDWEYPGNGIAGIRYRPQDKQNFTLLLRSLREAFGKRYLLTIAAADREFVENIDLHQVPDDLDWINLMSYDFFNSLTATTGHHGGLYRSEHALPRDRNADSAVAQYLAAGVPPDKIVLGVAFYGRGFAGVTARNTGVNQPYEQFDGEHSYKDLVEKYIGKQGFVRYWDNRAQAPYLWNATTRVFITYDDPQSLAIKARYVLQHRLGGIMFWELSEDRDDELLDVIDRGLQH
ncbi:MAG: glycoside hydrolase family 18 protein [Proteobacteria bacterium]|nr:glycoside hydrolase family 18 protein [Pseudomonadota bacterium]